MASDRAIAQAFWEIRPASVVDAPHYWQQVIERAHEIDAAKPNDLGDGGEAMAYLIEHKDGFSHLILANTIDDRGRAALVEAGRKVTPLHPPHQSAAGAEGLK